VTKHCVFINQKYKETDMLVLSRRRAQSIVVGENVEIKVIDILGNKIRLGIVAPKSIPVHRKEVFDSINNKKTAGSERFLSFNF
jgi:carbon storage regulator